MTPEPSLDRAAGKARQARIAHRRPLVSGSSPPGKLNGISVVYPTELGTYVWCESSGGN